ncbi:MAG: D-lysine 5,6-aminomutase subunit alpha [Elusimicrobia bacterium GWA2_61_42]|nr:MAG: D-lysine 5,6-aminomutase subunit alpha [Elusimicrobia bacterium GWA2_61_42]OGR77884.1 MAG: D-lysine 5,6-aminomutase subunit alpha [Elusimicrobia bacterium GWC2_61_25]
MTPVKSKLGLSPTKIAKARKLAAEITAPVQEFIDTHTTVTIERATLRLLGADGANADGVPVPNLIAQACADKLAGGASVFYVNALVKLAKTPAELNKEIEKGLDISKLELTDSRHIQKKADELIKGTDARIAGNVAHRNAQLKLSKDRIKSPMIYVIVATGNIYEDVKQAQAAAHQGADIIAVIRTTGQSLLDYVPYGPTTEGFGGTYATQENFRIMRKALDETGEKEGRYIRLVNYCSGLCMPEIAAMGALERLDMMLNDSMYGILFRDINMYRTFTDQFFSRMINTAADIIINTGEDNYLTTSDAVEKAHTVLASQFLNEKFAANTGMPNRLMGLGHAFEINPDVKNGFLYEYAQALMAREIFPEHPLKYMPPTKFMTGDIFKGLAMNTLFNFVCKATGQGIALLGMLTEAIHTPYLQDRHLAIDNALYVHNTMEGFKDEIEFKKDGIMARRARQVLDETTSFLSEVKAQGLFKAIETAMFAEIKRPRDGGKGFDGVYEKTADYWNPVETYLKKKLKIAGK